MKWDWRKLVVIFFVVGMAAGFGGYFSGNWLLEKIRSDNLRENAGRIQLALERYAFDHDGAYPHKPEALIDEKYLTQWPDNPYAESGEPMLPIPAGSPASHGDFVYLGFGPVIFLATVDGEPAGEKGAAAVEVNSGAPVLDQETVANDPPAQIDQYFLIFYGPGEGAEFTRFDEDRRSVFGDIDWNEVALMLTTGAPLAR